MSSSSLFLGCTSRRTAFTTCLSTARTTREATSRRLFASSSRIHADAATPRSSSVVNLGERSAGRQAAKDELGNPIGREPGPLYREWLGGEGGRFKNPRPNDTNWLGGSVPFPLNPSFKPPPPLSDRLRNLIFTEWVKDPDHNNPRALSIRHGISIKRVEAIIRLKSHEYRWKKDGRTLQTAFLEAFESATGVYKNVPVHKLRTATPPELLSRDQLDGLPQRDDAAAADYDADWEQLPKTDISRVYWEMVDEGGADPIVPGKLEELAEKKMARQRRLEHPDTGRAVKIGSTTFVDVGEKFSHTNTDVVKKTDPKYRGPLWKPEFSI